MLVLAAPAARAFEVPGTAERVTANGWLDGLAVAPTEGGREQLPEALLALKLTGVLTRDIRAHAELRSRIGGPFMGGHPGFYSLVHTFQNRSPSVEANEAWAEWRLAHAEVRAGIQKFAWGKLDGIPPTDVLNPSDYHDPIVQDSEERKIGIPALSASWYPPAPLGLDLHGLRATLIYVPIAVPSRLALLEERWFPPSTVLVKPIVIPRARIARLIPGFPMDLHVPISFRTRNRRPPHDLDDGGIAFRLSGTWHESDWDIYHYTGPETGPDIDIAPTAFLDSFDPMHLDRTRIHAVNLLRQAHDAIHMTGADVSTALGGATIRAEVATFINKPYLRASATILSPENLARLPLARITAELLKHGRSKIDVGDLFVTRDSVEWGVGADYLFHGFLPLVQVNQIVGTEPAPELLIADPETRFTGSLRRRFIDERLELEVRGIYELEREAWFVFPRASYLVRDDFRVRLGYLALGGPRASLFGQFKNNDEFVMQARYTF